MNRGDINEKPEPRHLLAAGVWFIVFAIAGAAACAMAARDGGNVKWLVLAYLGCLNTITYGMYVIDKHAARSGGRRISERLLLTFALLGGSLGGLVARLVVRHKTAKRSFRVKFALIVLLQLAGVVWAGIVWLSRN